METETMIKSNHGANVRRWREWRGLKQDVLAEMLGVGQATLSAYENKEILEKKILEKIAKALDVPVEAITEIGKDTYVNIFSGPSHDNSTYAILGNQIINPLDKIVELFEQKEALYQQMLKEKESIIDLLQEIVKAKG